MFILQNSVGFYSLFKRETWRFLKVYGQTLISPLLTNLLFLGVFGGTLQNREVGLEGIDYLSFLVPGLCIMGAMMGSFQNPSSSIIIQKYQGILQDLNILPLTTLEKMLAFVFSGATRGILIGIMTYLATIPFVGYTIEHPLAFFGALFLISFLFSLFGFIIGLLCQTFDQMSFLLNIVITPLIYFGGVFFEISRLPGILSNIAFFNPIFPLVDLTRYAYLGQSEGVLLINILLVIFYGTILFSVGYYLLKKGVGLKD